MFNLTAALNVIAPSRSVRTAVSDIERSLDRAERSATKFADAVALKGKGFVAYSVASAVVVKLSESIAQATRDALRFESELAKIAQTVGRSNQYIKLYANQIRQIGIDYGFSSVKIAETIRVLAQAGFTFEQSAKMAEELAKTTLLSSFESIADTTDGLIAVMKQFNLTGDDTEKVLSTLNVVAKKYAVESGDLVEAVRKAGGVFASTGGSLEELLTVFTTIRDTTRESAETIATGLRTIFSRIQRPRTIEYFRQFGIELTDLKGNFVGNYEAIQRIQKGLAANNVRPGSIQFAGVVQELGGVFQASRVIPLLTQAEKMQKVFADTKGSAAETAADIAKAQETLAFKLSQLQQQFSQFIYQLSDSSTFKSVASLLIGIANAAIKTASAFKELIPLIGAIGIFKIGRSLATGTKGVGRGFFFNSGGKVPGFGDGSKDTVPAMLAPGEFVIRTKAAQAIGYDKLHELNAQGYNKGGVVGVQHFAGGGIVKETTGMSLGDIGISVAALASTASLLGGVFSKITSGLTKYKVEQEKVTEFQKKVQAEIQKQTKTIADETTKRANLIGRLKSDLDSSYQREDQFRGTAAGFRAQANTTTNKRAQKRFDRLAAKYEQKADDEIISRQNDKANRDKKQQQLDYLTANPTRREAYAIKQREILTGSGKPSLTSRAGNFLNSNRGAIATGASALVTAGAVSVMNNLAEKQSQALAAAIENGDKRSALEALRGKNSAEGAASSIGASATAGAGIGAAIGTTVLPVLGTAGGAALGGLIGTVLASLDSLRSGVSYVADFFLSWTGFETFAEAEKKAEEEVIKQVEAVIEAKKAQEEHNKAMELIANTQAQINAKLIRSFTALDSAARQATSIADLGDIVKGLGSNSFRTSSLSTGLENGSARAIGSAARLTGARDAGNRLASLAGSSQKFEKAIDNFNKSKQTQGDLKSLQKAAADAAGIAGVEAPNLSGATFEDIQNFAKDLKDAEEKMRDTLVKTASSLEASFNSYVDSISVAANAQADYNQSLIDASQADRERNKEIESLSVRGSSIANIRRRIGDFGPMDSEGLRRSLAASSGRMAATGTGIAALQARGLGDTDAARRLQGDFSILQIATQQQITLLKQDTQVRQQLIEALKEELAIEKERAGVFSDISGALSGLYGSERQDVARQTASEAALVQRAFETGGISAATRQLGNAADNGENVDQLMQLLPSTVAEAIRNSAVSSGANTAAGITGGAIGSDFRTVGRTGFTNQGLNLASQVVGQTEQQTENQAALLRAQAENVQMLNDSSKILGESVNAIAGHFTNFSNELRGIVDSIKGASISMTMQPTNVVVTLNNAESLDLISREMKKMVLQTVSEQLIAQQQGR